MNLMFGFKETESINMVGLHPWNAYKDYTFPFLLWIKNTLFRYDVKNELIVKNCFLMIFRIKYILQKSVL
jgi:hypothetical protein